MSFYSGFDDKQDVARQFDVKLEDNIEILYAQYNQEGYEGYATVIYSQDGKLFEVHGSHCSCYGLEGQWSPEDCTYEDVIARAENGQFSNVNCHEIKKVVENWSATSHLGLDFSFDNLPDANEISEKLNIQKLIENKDFFINKEKVLQTVKKNISESIKQGVLNSSKEVEIKESLEVNSILKNYLSPEKLNTLILNEFKDIQEVLLKKNWKTNISLKDDTVIFDIKIPSLDSTNKKSKTKRML